MTILLAKKILDKFNRFVQLVNTTIGILNASVDVTESNKISIKIFQKIDGEASNYLLSKLVENLIQNISILDDEINDAYFDETNKIIFVSIFLTRNELEITNKLFNVLVKSLYLAVDDFKIEYGFIVERDDFHDVPNEIFWRLDDWNDGWVEEDEIEKCISDEQLISYKIEKNALYGITLGYYDIDLNLLETDIVPEIIGILFESIEDFCYVTSYEDEKYIYIYSCKELNEDNIFDLEEGLFNILHTISENNQFETLEDVVTF